MRLYISLLLAASCLFAVPAHAEARSNTVFVIPIKGMIERGLLYVVRRGLQQAEKDKAQLVVFHMDTPGGQVGATEEIVQLLISLPDTIKTCTFVDKDALSAGAIISVATDDIYMAPGSRIGASGIIGLSGKEDKDNEENRVLREKHESALVALATSAAKRHGHDEKVVEAMILRDVEYKIGDKVISPKGKLLTLTDLSATEMVGEEGKKRPLLAKDTAVDLDGLLKKLKLTGAERITLEITWSEHMARWIELFRGLFLLAGVLGIYIEVRTPGFGLPGILGVICLSIFFWGHSVAGLAGWGEMLIFVVGVVLLAVEIFAIPGFGVTGIAGIVCILTSLIMAMIQHGPGLPVYQVEGSQIYSAVKTMSFTLVASFALMCVLAKYLPQTSLFRKVMLTEAIGGGEATETVQQQPDLVGLSGVAQTPLRPSGIGTFGDRRLNIVARGEFIDQGARIVITETHGNRIVVESAQDAANGKEA